MPTYLKTLTLEAKIIELEKKNADTKKKKLIPSRVDSPAFSLTYQSDAIKNNNLSIKYSDLSETEAKELMKKMENTHSNKSKYKNELSEIQIPSEIAFNRINQNGDIFNDTETTINIKLADIVKPTTSINKITCNELQMNECEKLLEGLSNDINNIKTEEEFDLFSGKNLNMDVIKSISESIHYADLPSENNNISDIPEIKKKNKPRPRGRPKKTIQRKI